MRLGRRGRDQENDMVWGPPYEVRISHKGKESGVTFVHLYELICGHFDTGSLPQPETVLCGRDRLWAPLPLALMRTARTSPLFLRFKVVKVFGPCTKRTGVRCSPEQGPG